MKKTFLTLAAMFVCMCGMSQALVFHLTDGTTYTADVDAALSITPSDAKFVIVNGGRTKELPMERVTTITGTAPTGILKYDVNGDAHVDVADIATIVGVMASNGDDIPNDATAPEGVVAVDLGLPSGTMWANMNVGAEHPEDYGLFFAWGETTGYGTDTSDGYTFDWAGYKWCAGSYFDIVKYCTKRDYGIKDDKIVLELDDDAAHVNWGGDWRMPTYEEMKELLDYTTNEPTTLNGVDGIKFTSNVNGNSIFLPVAGYRENNNLFYSGFKGYYWTSTLVEGSPKWAYALFTNKLGSECYGYYRTNGQSIRPVTKTSTDNVDDIHPDGPYEHEDGEMPCVDEGDFTAIVSANGEALPGGATIINITTPELIDRFYIAISGQEGYYIKYTDEPVSDGGNYLYRLLLMLPQAWNHDVYVKVGGFTQDGRAFACQDLHIRYHEAETGALQVSLTFDNAKDVDLHLYTPSNVHYFYGNKGGYLTDSNGNRVYAGLDVDSNAGCNIDNINCENITLPEEMLEEGEYRVVVDMYKNCDPSIPTGWSCVATRGGQLISNKLSSYGNPASGVYPVRQSNGDMTVVMRFNVKEVSGSRVAERKQYIFEPVPLDESAIMKLAELKAREEQE